MENKSYVRYSFTIVFFCLCFVFRPFFVHYLYADSFSYADYETVLKLCVDKGEVDISALQKNKQLLLHFLNEVHILDKTRYEKWTRNEKTAFWINVYNACALSYLIKYPSLEKLTEIPEDPQTTFFSVFGEKISLSQIKHVYVRGESHDERIHFAIVTPAKGFPKLRNEAYQGAYVNLLLEEDVTRFLNDPDNCQIDMQAKEIALSQIFQWAAVDFIERYANDIPQLQRFTDRERAVLKFISNYLPPYKEFILSGDYTLSYLEFDWTLNTKNIPG
jgi:hypothetical protein